MFVQSIARSSATPLTFLRVILVWGACFIVTFAMMASQAHGATISTDPTFLLPNSATNDPVVFPTERPVAPGFRLRGSYFDAAGNPVSQDTGSVYTSAPGSLTWGPAGSQSTVYADPASFDARSKFVASTDGSLNKFTFGSAQVWNWYILTGNPGAVTLAVDILIQGQAFANNGPGGNASAIFGTSLGFLSSPSDLIQDYAIALTGAVNWTAGFSTNNTVDVDVLWEDIGSTTHDVNYVVRSQPFTATVGVPFRLSLISSTQGFAGPGAWGEAWADFYDPRIVTSFDFPTVLQLSPDGFSVVLDGGTYSTLSTEGYSIAQIPEPGTLALLGLGLAGLAASRRREQ